MRLWYFWNINHEFTQCFINRRWSNIYVPSNEWIRKFTGYFQTGDIWRITDASFMIPTFITVARFFFRLWRSLWKEASGSHLGFVVSLQHKTYFIKQAKNGTALCLFFFFFFFAHLLCKEICQNNPHTCTHAHARAHTHTHTHTHRTTSKKTLRIRMNIHLS